VPLPERRDYSWPGGKRLAFVISTNVEWFAFGAGLGHDPAKTGEPQTHRNYSWRDYGNRIGIWRLLELFDELELPGVVALIVEALERALRPQTEGQDAGRLLIGELQEYLKTQLPAYMVPSVLVTIEALPLTPTGKVDRRSLLSTGQPMPKLDMSFMAPRDMIELELSRIWERVLNIQPVGMRDDFFEVGGHSMLAVRLMAQIQNRFGQELPLSVLFQRSTIEELAVVIRRQAAQMNNSPLVSIRSEGAKRPLFGVHPIGGNVLCYVELARHLDPDQPLYGLQSVTLYDDDKRHHSSVQDTATCFEHAVSLSLSASAMYCTSVLLSSG